MQKTQEKVIHLKLIGLRGILLKALDDESAAVPCGNVYVAAWGATALGERSAEVAVEAGGRLAVGKAGRCHASGPGHLKVHV